MKSKIEKLGKVSITVEKDYWNKNKPYNRLTIVERQGTTSAYLSRKVVPIGVDITDRNYWITISKWADIPYEIVQEFGDSPEVVISQKVVTLKVNELRGLIDGISDIIGEGGSIDERITTAISDAKNEIVDGASEEGNTFKKIEDRLSDVEESIGEGGSVDERIAIETNRAQAAEELLREAYKSLSQSQVISKTAEEWAAMTSWEKDVIYRVAGTTSYTDYMYNGATTIPMATYNNAIDDVPTTGSNNLAKSDGIAKHVSSIVGGILETNIPSIVKREQYPFVTLGKGLYKITVIPKSESDILSANIYYQSDSLIGSLTNQANVAEFEITNEIETIKYYRGSSDTVNNNSTILIQNITDSRFKNEIVALQNTVGGFDISGYFETIVNRTVQIPISINLPANSNFFIKIDGTTGVIFGDYFKLWAYADETSTEHSEIDYIPINTESRIKCSFDFDVKKIEIVKAKTSVTDIGSFSYNVVYNRLDNIEEHIDTNTFYVNGESGVDTNDGRTSATAFKTFAKATEMMANREKSVLHIAKGLYKEELNLSLLKGSVSIYGQVNEEVIISGSEVITGWEAVSSYQGIYKALFDDTILVHGSHNLNRGVIYEVGRSSGLIDTSERHPSQKGLSYRLPFTPIQQSIATTLSDALIDISANGGWYVDGGYIYIKNVDGSNPETNGYSYEYEKSRTFVSSNKIEHLLISNISFRYTTSVVFNALFTERYNCSVIGCNNDGFKDNTYRLKSYFDECSFCGNDGANGHFNSTTNWTNCPLRNSGEIVEYYYAWMHDNFDDGLSHHEASHIRVIGGLYEYNGDGGIRVSNTSNTEVFSAYFRKNGQDNSSVNAKGSGIDCVNTALTGDTRNGCNTIVYDCVSEYNKIGYGCLDTNNIITLINCISSNNSVAELYANAGKVITKNCKYIQPDISKTKVVENNGEILVNNYSDFA